MEHQSLFELDKRKEDEEHNNLCKENGQRKNIKQSLLNKADEF